MITNTILQGHVLDKLRELPAESIDCVITSPPYFQLRAYSTEPQDWGDWKGELGLEPSPDLFVKHLCDVFDEVKRVLKPSGTCFVNLGDSYSGSGKGVGGSGQKESFVFSERPMVDEGIPSKCLVQIPSRFALEMTSPKYILREDLTFEEKSFVIGELVKRGII